MRYTVNSRTFSFVKIPMIEQSRLAVLTATHLKVLYGIYYGYFIGDTSSDAQNLGLCEADYISALRFWEEEGFLDLNIDVPKSSDNFVSVPYRIPSDLIEPEKRIEIKEMYNYVKELIKSDISRSMRLLICNLIDYYRFECEACKKFLLFSFRFIGRKPEHIERVAREWATGELLTKEYIEQKIDDYMDFDNYCDEIFVNLGLNKNPRIITDYIKRWYDTGFSAELVDFAIEKSIDNTSKHNVSLAYVDACLNDWQEKGITCPDDWENSEKSRNDSNRRNKEDFVSDGHEDDVEKYLKNHNLL